MSVDDWCKKTRLSQPTYYYRLRKRREAVSGPLYKKKFAPPSPAVVPNRQKNTPSDRFQAFLWMFSINGSPYNGMNHGFAGFFQYSHDAIQREAVLADWDTIKTNRFANGAIAYHLGRGNGKLPQETVITFEP